MIKIQQEVPLRSRNTFGIAATASVYVETDTIDELADYVRSLSKPDKTLILGGGSNILFASERCQCVIHPAIKGIDVVEETDGHVLIRVGAGEIWDEFVAWCVQRNYAGVENLSNIPGTVGACPIQNIGAYGAEAKETIETVEAIDMVDKQTMTFSKNQCCFDYRDSFFKQNKGKYIITAVCFRLSKNFIPNLKYADLQNELSGETDIDVKKIRQAVTNIRSRKLPDFSELGNAGSFFKNPTICYEKSQIIKQKDPKAPIYPASNGLFKISAAWLIRQCDWSNFREGNVGVHKQQPLVIVNYGNATGKEVIQLADRICSSVLEKFDIEMEKEVNIVLG